MLFCFYCQGHDTSLYVHAQLKIHLSSCISFIALQNALDIPIKVVYTKLYQLCTENMHFKLKIYR